MFLYVLLLSLVTPSHALKPVSCYSYKPETIKLEWTAYKFTEKTGVKATFKTIKHTIQGAPQSVADMVTKTSFDIDATSVDSGNPARDITLTEHFFKVMKNTKISGKVVSLKDGVAKVDLTMNGVTKSVDFKVEANDTKVDATATIDILDFSMNASLKKINESCFELHKGKDGVSKTWSTVDLHITAEPQFTCKKKG